MQEHTLSERRVFEGRALRLDVLDVELDNGVRSVREIIRHPGAVVVLAELPVGRFVLVRQYRKAIESELIEAVAGTLEPGEEPLECARRELKEETGYCAHEMIPLGDIVSSPGYSEERLYLFYAKLDATAGEMTPDEDESLETVMFDRDHLEHAIREGEICDAKTIVIWYRYLEMTGG